MLEIAEIKNRISKIDPNNVMNLLGNNEMFIELVGDLNRSQLLAGLNADGQYLPRYVDDPYFKSKESAIAYQNWKEKISPDKSKPKEVMDFFITGVYHETIKAVYSNQYITLTSDSEIKNSVDSKTSAKALGINEESVEVLKQLIIKIIRPLILEVFTGNND